MNHRAAFQPAGCETPFLLTRKVKQGATYFPDRERAFRALERAGRYHGGGRGFVWSTGAGPHLTAADLTSGRPIPVYVETIAL
jgi:hypothetical protein